MRATVTNPSGSRIFSRYVQTAALYDPFGVDVPLNFFDIICSNSDLLKNRCYSDNDGLPESRSAVHKRLLSS